LPSSRVPPSPHTYPRSDPFNAPQDLHPLIRAYLLNVLPIARKALTLVERQIVGPNACHSAGPHVVDDLIRTKLWIAAPSPITLPSPTHESIVKTSTSRVL
jgi:hypothetical protein